MRVPTDIRGNSSSNASVIPYNQLNVSHRRGARAHQVPPPPPLDPPMQYINMVLLQGPHLLTPFTMKVNKTVNALINKTQFIKTM